jgi:putative phosphoesterase
MRVFFISDIHGNQYALEAILAKATTLNVDSVYCLGDISGYFTGTNEVVRLLKEHHVVAIKGNHDAFLSGDQQIQPEKGYFEAYLYTKNHTLNSVMDWINGLSETAETEHFKLYHGGPNDLLNEYIFPNQIKVDDFQNQAKTIFLFGHTHLQFVVKKNNQTFANPGSVGLPRNGDFRAHGLLYDTVNEVFNAYKIPYEVDKAISDFSKMNVVNTKYLHNLNFGRSSPKTLIGSSNYFFNEDSILALYNRGFSVINTRFGAVLSRQEEAFMANIIYVANYNDGTVEITSNTLIFNWEEGSKGAHVGSERFNPILSRDNAGLHYRKAFNSIEEFNLNLLNNIQTAFIEVDFLKNWNGKI